jgi:hypothetical protein
MAKIANDVFKDTQNILHGASTTQGIEMLSLTELEMRLRDNYPELFKEFKFVFNIAGNKYCSALAVIRDNAKALGIEEDLYK